MSRDISDATVNDLAFKSQVDENIICADKRFEREFDDNLIARPQAFRFKRDPSDFLYYTFIVEE